MRVQYDATIDELVEVHQRVNERSKIIRSWYFRGAVYSSAISFLFWVIPVALLTYVFPSLIILFLALGVIMAASAAYTTWSQYDERLRKRVRKYLVEQLDGQQTVPFEIEIDEKEIRIKQQETRIIYEWSNVEDIIETEKSFDFILRNGSMIMVRKRAFPEIENQEEFQRESQLYLNRSRMASNWLRGDEN